jgi:HK97 family phage major capsid protein
MKNIQEMKRKAFAKTQEARAISDKADAEKRQMTAEERVEVSRILDAAGAMDDEIRLEENLQKREMAKVPADEHHRDAAGGKPEKRAAFLKYIRGGKTALNSEERALVEDTTGDILVPEDLETEIERTTEKISVMRTLATARPIKGDRLRRRSLTEVTMSWGKLEKGAIITESTPTPAEEWAYVEDLSGLAKIGRDELQDNDANLEALIMDSFARAKAETEDTGFTIGTGHTYQQPEGVAVDSGISTIDLITDDVVVAEDVLKLEYELPAQYLKGASYLMHRKTELVIRLLRAGGSTTTDGPFLWQPSLQVGMPPTFDGFPIYNQSDMNYPADALLKNVMVFGNFKLGYRILDKGGMTIQRLEELYAEEGCVGFLAYFRAGGYVAKADALRALKNNT